MGAVQDEADRRLPDSWLSDLAILFAAALRRTPRRILACMAITLVVFLIAPFDFVIPLAVAFGVIAGTLETSRPAGGAFPTWLAAALGFASLVAILTYDQITVLRFDTDRGSWFSFINSSLESELHAQVIGLPGRIATLSAVAVLAAVLVRVAPRVGRRATIACGVVALLVALAGIVYGFTLEIPFVGDIPLVHGASLTASVILVVLGARLAGTRWIAVISVLAVASAVGFNYFSTLLIGIVATAPIAGRTSAALVAGANDRSADAAAARLTARFARRPLRTSAVAYLCVAAISWFLDWAAVLTALWLSKDWGSDEGSSFAALSVVVPPIWQTAIVIGALGALHAKGLATQLGAVCLWIVLPFVLGFAFFSIIALRNDPTVRGPAALAYMPMFYPFALATLAGVAVSINAPRVIRNALVCAASAMCLLAPWAIAYTPGADEFLGAQLEGDGHLAVTAASMPFLFVTGALATMRRPRGTTLALLAALLLVSLLALIPRPEDDLMHFAHVLPEVLAAGVAIVAILIARRLHGVSPLPDDHAVFVLRRERDGVTA